MIGVNLFALPVGAAIAAVCVGLDALSPELMTGTKGDFLVGGITVIIGATAECVGIRGRILFLPIWFVGIIIIGFQLYEWFGGWRLLGGSALVIAAGFLAYSFFKYSERRKWNQLRRDSFAEKTKFVSSPPEYWRLVDTHLFLPALLDYDVEIHAYDQAILKHILSRKDAGLEVVEIAVVTAFSDELRAVEFATKKRLIDHEKLKAIRELIMRKANAKITASRKGS